MNYLGSLAFFAVCFILIGYITVFIIIRRKKQPKELLSSIYIAKAGNSKAKLSANYPFLKQVAYKLRDNKSQKYILKQTLRWDMLMLIICTKCFGNQIIFYTNTWLFKEFELEQFKNYGFTVKSKSFLGQLPARFITAVSFWQLHRNFKGALGFFGNKKKFYRIIWDPEAANRLLSFFTANE